MHGPRVEKFIEKAVEVHGSIYDYSKVEYRKNSSKVEIICREHGSFILFRGNHIKGTGCTKCTPQKTSLESFIERSKEKHSDFFDYSSVSFKKTRDKVEIICPNHGSFFQEARDHMRGIGCRKCSNDNRKVSFKEFQERAIAKHGNKYSYSESNWTGDRRTTIECPKHGEFLQFWYNHTIGDGCQKCSVITFEEFLKRSKETHGNTYDYSKTVFTSASDKVNVMCRTHGEFTVSPHSHFRGANCFKCSFKNTSLAEQDLAKFIKSLGVSISPNDRSVLGRKEIDVYIPSLNLGFEFNGDYWHSDKVISKKCGITAQEYHSRKLNAASEAGVTLYFVWESDWTTSRTLIESAIKSVVYSRISQKPLEESNIELLSQLTSPLDSEFLDDILQ